MSRTIQSAEMAQETNQSQAPMLCATGCGFFGNPRTSGMCSVCYKDHLTRQNNGVSPLSAMGKICHSSINCSSFLVIFICLRSRCLKTQVCGHDLFLLVNPIVSHLGGSVSSSPTMEASAIQRIEATLNNAAAAAAEADAEAAR